MPAAEVQHIQPADVAESLERRPNPGGVAEITVVGERQIARTQAAGPGLRLAIVKSPLAS